MLRERLVNEAVFGNRQRPRFQYSHHLRRQIVTHEIFGSFRASEKLFEERIMGVVG
jgi:hypothetical protein